MEEKIYKKKVHNSNSLQSYSLKVLKGKEKNTKKIIKSYNLKEVYENKCRINKRIKIFKKLKKSKAE